LAAFALIAIGATGCIVHDRSDTVVVHDDEPYFTTVDADETLSTNLGEGAGAFVEYQKGGVWRLWTSCDTLITGAVCRFEANVYPRGRLDSLAGIDLESSDGYEIYSDGTFTFVAETELGSDGIEFVTDPGALVDIELILDGYVDPSYLVWYGNGKVHDGAPRSPVVFQPDAP
jgi:hypothetical protein